MSAADFPIDWCRDQFPALKRTVGDQPVAFFDGPGGSQVPQRVIDAVSGYWEIRMPIVGAVMRRRSRATNCWKPHVNLAEFVGTPHPESIIFGANMTTLTFALSRAIGRTWRTGDEVIVTRLDHDGNVSPWVMAAHDAGAIVHYVDFHESDCTLNLDDFKAKLSPKTRFVAVGCASNIVGSINPVHEICRLAHLVEAEVFLDAVHYAPHGLPDFTGWDCDWLACSAYKFFGPHIGILCGRPELLRLLAPYKLRPVTEELPGRWMTGTQNFEGIAGANAAIEYLVDLGKQVGSPSNTMRPLLAAAYAAIADYERDLAAALLTGLLAIPQIKVLGLTDLDRLQDRTPTISFVHEKLAAVEIAEQLGQLGLFVGHGNFYALQLTEKLGLEPQGVIRVGLMHYNTRSEVDRLLNALRSL